MTAVDPDPAVSWRKAKTRLQDHELVRDVLHHESHWINNDHAIEVLVAGTEIPPDLLRILWELDVSLRDKSERAGGDYSQLILLR
ncbi:MAG: hypothetical protein ACLFR6_06350 [Salinarchaeum sp.]